MSDAQQDPETLACFSCGVEASGNGLKFRAMAVEGENLAIAQTRQKFASVTLGECGSCRDRHEFAELLVMGRLGGRDGTTTTDRLGAALDGLAVLGKPMPKLGDNIGAILRHMTPPGANTRWAARYAPLWTKGAKSDQTNTEAWGHLSEEQMQVLRDAYGKVLAERVAKNAPPVEIAPPQPSQGAGEAVRGGCLFCGVSAVTASAQRVVIQGGIEAVRAAVWTEKSVSMGALGSKTSHPVRGHLCPACMESVSEVGSVGMSSIERAFTRHMRGSGRGNELPHLGPDDYLDGLNAWCTTGQPATRDPWSHIVVKREGAS